MKICSGLRGKAGFVGGHVTQDGNWQGLSGLGSVASWQDEEAALSPLAAGISVLNEVGTVLIDRIISQMHTDLILGKETQDHGSG